MKASCVLALLCGAEILGAFLCAAANSIDGDEDPESSVVPTILALTPTTTEVTTLALPTTAHIPKANLPPVYDAKPTTTNPTTTVTTATPSFNIYRKECLSHLMVSGGLIILCFILLMCMLLLTCRVCQLTRRIKALGSHDELVSNSGYWTGTAKKNKSEPAAEAKETSMLMADMGNGAAKEGEVAEADEKGEEEPAKEEEKEGEQKEKGEAAAGGGEEEAAAEKEEDTTPAEASSTPEQQEEAADSQSTETTQAPTSEQPNESV